MAESHFKAYNKGNSVRPTPSFSVVREVCVSNCFPDCSSNCYAVAGSHHFADSEPHSPRTPNAVDHAGANKKFSDCRPYAGPYAGAHTGPYADPYADPHAGPYADPYATNKRHSRARAFAKTVLAPSSRLA